jgi:hypothetical protein
MKRKIEFFSDEYKRSSKFTELSESNTKCDEKLFSTNSFCTFNKDQKKCMCKFQKDEVKYLFDSLSSCCNRKCSSLSEDECVSDYGYGEMPYYCNIGGKCIEYKGIIISSHISSNNCGTDPLNNQLVFPFASLEECQKSVDPCDKYNNPNNTFRVNREGCLKDVNCGYCTNENSSDGKCISGTATGPNDLQTYFYCDPNQKGGKNSYQYGNHATYLL